MKDFRPDSKKNVDKVQQAMNQLRPEIISHNVATVHQAQTREENAYFKSYNGIRIRKRDA